MRWTGPERPGRHRVARLVGATALALAGLAPAWAAGPAPAAAVTHPTGGVVAWGDNSAGQTDVPVEARTGVISVAAGCAHSLALRSDGRVVAWGDNRFGQTNVPAAAQSGVAGIVAGCDHNLALKSNGTIVAWGDNSEGQINVPSLPRGWKWSNIAAGMIHSVGVARSSSAVDVYVWGDNSAGQADVTPSDSDSILSVDWHDIADVEAGGLASIARMGDGTVRVWGNNIITVMVPAPADLANVRKVPAGLSGVVGMSMGGSHALVVKSNGTVVAWGDNASGQTKVPKGVSKVKAVAAGGYHSLALLSNGQVVGWGWNDVGQASAPPRPNSRYVWIAAGRKHSLAVGQLTPNAPQSVTATPWDGAVTLSWTAPDDLGFGPITLYTVTAAPGGQTCTAAKALACTIGGLTNGTAYTFSVTARNSIGMGQAAVSLPAAPAVPVPATPEPSATPTPSPAPSATPAPVVVSGGGSGGGLPLPVLIAIALMIGLGAAAIAYKPSLIGARVRELAVRLRAKTSTPPAEPAADPEPIDPPEFTRSHTGTTKR